MADVAQQTPRSSGGSAPRRAGSRSRQHNPQQQLSTIEKSVTHLLVATKQLLETLTQWARGTATEGEVSDVYVRLGYEFNIACRAFSAIGVDTADLGPVPDLLRTILEDTLSQVASQASLDKYLPRIRDIIINLLQGLKRKQQRLRPRDASKEGSESSLPRQSSVSSSVRESSLTQQLDEFPTRTGSVRPQDQNNGGSSSMPDLPPRTASGTGDRQSPRRMNTSPQNSMRHSSMRDAMPSEPTSTTAGNPLQNIPTFAPYPEADSMPTVESASELEMAPPMPPPKHNDALSALQRGPDLERRASRRFSAYHLTKHLGSGVAAIPPPQNSPIPNRGRDVRESLSAVRSRGNTYVRTRSKGQLAGQDVSPNRQPDAQRISEVEENGDLTSNSIQLPPKIPAAEDIIDSPTVKTPEDKLGAYPFTSTGHGEDRAEAAANGPNGDQSTPDGSIASSRLHRQKSSAAVRGTARGTEIQTPPPTPYVPESPPRAGRELTLFLQYKSKIKKFVLPDGGDLSIPRLQLAFIEKFAWSTQNNGVDLPEIYIQDPVSGVRHELEDLSDIKERSVLVLNVEALDEVKRHIDDGLGGLRRLVEGIRVSMEDQQTAIQRVSDRQQETARDLASFAAVPPRASLPPPAIGTRSASVKDTTGQLIEVQSLRRDLAIVRQTYTSFVSEVEASMAAIRTKATSVKQAASTTVAPASDPTTGRVYVNTGKKQLSEDSEKIVNRVDDLQDMVEDLRKDVVSRGVRPLPRQLESVSRDISTATADLKKLQEFLKHEKPIWTKIWEKELQVVCDDRDLLTLQEELAIDLEDDLEKAAATFALVEQATKQQAQAQPDGTSTIPGPAGLSSVRSTSRTIAVDPGADPRKAKDSMLGEVRALQPNHESRLEAIERAERARARELDNRKGGEFQRELGAFVDEGRLKKTGGIDEVERVRKIREEKARREVAERQAQRMRERIEKEAAAAAAGAANPGPAPTAAEPTAVVPNGESRETSSSDLMSSSVSHLDGSSSTAPTLPDLHLVAPLDETSFRDASPEGRFVDAVETVGNMGGESGEAGM